ncbi:hypothetical protein F5877DRAFT_86578 [Lentinula edodes]|nr:hypothetical protein F5877DRAFT_86578 [Lentinula edodes]
MTLRCRLCWANIDDSSVPERQRHYGAHVLSEESEENPRANSSSWTTSKKFSLWISKGKLRNPMTANVEKSQDVFWRPAMKMPPPKNSFRLFHFPEKYIPGASLGITSDGFIGLDEEQPKRVAVV